jgi:hypothetical protein
MSQKPKARESSQGVVTRNQEFHYTNVALSSCSLLQKYGEKFKDKQFTDAFLPHWTISKLKGRLSMEQIEAQNLYGSIAHLKDSKHISTAAKCKKATADDLAEVVAAVVKNGGVTVYGLQQQCIDNYLRENGVQVSKTEVHRALHPEIQAKKSKSALSEESIAMISNLMFVATADTSCKPELAVKHFVRAAAMLERNFASKLQYLERNRELPPVYTSGLRSANATNGASYTGPQINVDSDTPSSFESIQVVYVDDDDFEICQNHAVSGSFDEGYEDDGNGSGSPESDDDKTICVDRDYGPEIEDDAEELLVEDDEEELLLDDDLQDYEENIFMGEPRQIAWNGPLPMDSTDERSMRYARRAQIHALMKANGWKSYKAQWVDKHRRKGADPITLKMYFEEKRAFCERNGIVLPEQDINGDETLFRGEITELLRQMRMIIATGPNKSDKHAYATTEDDRIDSYPFVVFPVISRIKCHLIQVILKGPYTVRAGSTQAVQRATLIRQITNALPKELTVYVNFSKTGYQNCETFKDMCRALLVALHKEESVNNGWMNMYTTPMSETPPLQLKRMFKFDGSKTHCLSDHQLLIELVSRNLLPFPFTPNATAFLQECDQLGFFIFKNSAKRIVRLEIIYDMEKPDLSNPYVKCVWENELAHVYSTEIQDHHDTSLTGHKGFKRYECRVDVCEKLQQMADRAKLPWGQLRMAKMVGWSLGRALLDPRVLEASFKAVEEENVWKRPLVVREQQFLEKKQELMAQKSLEISQLGQALRGKLAANIELPAARIHPAIAVQRVANELWADFRSDCLMLQPTEEMPSEATFREFCDVFNSYAIEYRAHATTAEKLNVWRKRLRDADDVRAHLANRAEEESQAHAKAVTEHEEFMNNRVSDLKAHVEKMANARDVLLEGAKQHQTELLRSSADLEPAVNQSTKVRQTYQKLYAKTHKAIEKVKYAITETESKLQNVSSAVISRKSSKFPNRQMPPPAQDAYDSVVAELSELVASIKCEVRSFEAANATAKEPVGVVGAVSAARGGGAVRGAARGVSGRGRGGRAAISREALDLSDDSDLNPPNDGKNDDANNMISTQPRELYSAAHAVPVSAARSEAVSSATHSIDSTVSTCY